MNGYAPLGGRLKALVIAFALMTVVLLVSALFGVLEIALVNRLIAGEEVPNADLIANDERNALLVWVWWPVRIACIVTFITWMYRAYHNVAAVEPGGRRFEPGWAIGGWFVPFLAMWRPKQIMNDIWRAGDTHQAFAIGTAWWALWLFSIPYGWITSGSYRRAETPEELRSASTALLVGDLIAVATAVLAIVVAVQATRRLDRRAEGQSRPPKPEWQIAPPVERRADEPFPAYPA
jgi:hypothetical protein